MNGRVRSVGVTTVIFGAVPFPFTVNVASVIESETRVTVTVQLLSPVEVALVLPDASFALDDCAPVYEVLLPAIPAEVPRVAVMDAVFLGAAGEVARIKIGEQEYEVALAQTLQDRKVVTR